MFGEVKLQVGGASQQFWWVSPVPTAATPSLTIRHPTLGDTTPTLAPVHVPITITAISSDRRTLTASTTITAGAGAEGSRFGAAFLVTPRDGYFDITARRLSGTSVILAEPLPAGPSITATTTATISWAIHSATVSSALVSTATRNVPWDVDYLERFGTDVTGYGQQDEGILHIVRQPFRTGLTSRNLAAMYPGIAPRTPRRQSSWAPQIEAALAELIQRLREDLTVRGLTEDDVGGHRLRLAHAALACAYVYDETQPEKAEALRTRALGPADPDTGRRSAGLVDDALRAVWADANFDGVVDAGEVGNIEGARGSDVGSYFTSSAYTSTTRRFTRNERH